MILVDSSVWIDHFRKPEPDLIELLQKGVVLTHPAVIEELACGVIREMETVLDLLQKLPKAPSAQHGEVMGLIAAEKLSGSGVGAVDVHLLAAARLAHAKLWTKDKALANVARRLDLIADGYLP